MERAPSDEEPSRRPRLTQGAHIYARTPNPLVILSTVTSESDVEPASGQTRQLTPSQVIETAARIADDEGIDAVTLTRVAKELGVRQPALYRHVDGVAALWSALALRARDALVGRLTDAAVGRSRAEAITDVAHAWRQFVVDHPGLYSATDRIASAGDPELEASVDRVVRVIALAISGYHLSDESTMHAARSIRSALHGFCLLEKDGGHPPPYSLDDSFDRLVALLIAGVDGMVERETADQRG